MAQLRAHYERWWKELEPLSGEFVTTSLGAEAQPVVNLTSSDWQDVYVDNSRHVRQANGGPRGGPWNVRVERAGDYEISVRRWPPEVDTALTAENGTGSRALPIAGAKLTVAGQEQSAKAEAGDKAVTFRAKLPAGPTRLQAWFVDRDGKDLCGAFYATIRCSALIQPDRIDCDSEPGIPRSLLSLKSMRKMLCILIALLLLALPASAWNGLGHRTVAELAWRQMDPAERRAASDLLRQHPHYRELLVAEVPAGVDTNEWAFLTAAVWLGHGASGQSRGSRTSRTRSPNTTCIPTRSAIPSSGRPTRNRVSLDKFSIAKPNAEMVLSNSLVTLRNPKASAHDRAVSLCGALHLFGDLHQPLHTANLVTKDKPKGHGLGSSFLVRDERGEQINLHTFWDYSPGPDLSYQAVAALADKLAAAPELQPATAAGVSSAPHDSGLGAGELTGSP